jgi:hypothetical protein
MTCENLVTVICLNIKFLNRLFLNRSKVKNNLKNIYMVISSCNYIIYLIFSILRFSLFNKSNFSIYLPPN